MTDQMGNIGRILIVAGAALFVLGLVLVFGGRFPFVGRLPGDMVIERKNITVYLPITTSVIVSLLLSLIFWIAGRK